MSLDVTTLALAKSYTNQHGGSGGSVPKPLAYDYMPEGYPSKAMGTITLMEEQELAFRLNNGVYLAGIKNTIGVVAGQTYIVNWDGTEYECVGAVFNSIPIFGNLSVAGMGDDTGEPFLYIDNINNSTFQFVTLDTSASHTIGVKRTEEVITPMAEEFLPAGVGTAAVITYVSSTNTYSSDLTYDELHEILLDHRQVVFWKPEENQCSYLTKWAEGPNGSIGLAFGGDDYSVVLDTDGTFEEILK